MRVARFSVGQDPRYGLVELAEDNGPHPDTIGVLTGDPLAMAVQFTGERVPLSQARLLAPVIPRSKVVGVGRNYAAHAAELGNEVPQTPLTFYKPNTAVIGPGEPIIYPSFSEQVSFEGELAVVIGRICKEVPVERAQDVIFGYTIANDVTARDKQGPDKQWARAKGFDTSCPLGPWITSHYSIEEAGELMITTTLDGEQRQHGSTSLMIHPIAELIAYISSFTTLLPGDVILTGTPEGVGLMIPGQEVSVSIEGMGTLTNKVISADPDHAGESK
ncbi:fumarylacetoacetate hydrolase family protein [Naumannella sp. ID2617S]|uniref:2-hydroxyhepta-2,4-diene-1,7-dioate isomerase n=1 Tax=Enemella dayhoffiae TaxID=2016507 RepID=A0A255H346_9ACTN|nr:fumarylacetoacetate hydrolase family protein [Enemella dayhoffiae]NNG19431.1 fumarylacetoacetate hydrolase family protein [Naumannella sp. ID2617S]OYO22071.1 2-hydroxyhepta-2,4-diene-1,7-dioate isomerase [Enemella dayhoffiae]